MCVSSALFSRNPIGAIVFSRDTLAPTGHSFMFPFGVLSLDGREYLQTAGSTSIGKHAVSPHLASKYDAFTSEIHFESTIGLN